MSGYNTENTTTAPQNGKEFKHGLLDCLSGGIAPFIITWFVPCYTYALVEESISNQDSICANFALTCCCPIIHCCLIMNQRKKVQMKQGIEVDGCHNCCTATFCGCCALIQHSSELGSFDA